MARSSYNKQFKKGTVPLQHWDESTRVNGHEQDPPDEYVPKKDSPRVVKKRQGISRGSQTEAYPGMSGVNDYSRKRRS